MTQLDRADRALGVIRVGVAMAWLSQLSAYARIAEIPGSLWHPVSFAAWWKEYPPPEFLNAIFALAVFSAACLLFGLFTRVSSILSVAAGVVIGCLANSTGKIIHGGHGVLLVMFALSVSNWGRAFSIDALRRRREAAPRLDGPTGAADGPVWLATFTLALLYFSAGMLKVVHGEFLQPEYLQSLMKRKLIESEFLDRGTLSPAVLAIYEWGFRHPNIARATTFLAVAFELGFCLCLFDRRLRPIAFSAAIAFHASNAILVQAYFRQQIFLLATLLSADLFLQYAARREPAVPPAERLSAPSKPTEPLDPRTRSASLGLTAVPLAVALIVWISDAPVWGWIANAHGVAARLPKFLAVEFPRESMGLLIVIGGGLWLILVSQWIYGIIPRTAAGKRIVLDPPTSRSWNSESTP